jgi:hypothetical protein
LLSSSLIEGVQPFTLRQARKSALVVAALLAAIAAWQVYRGHKAWLVDSRSRRRPPRHGGDSA